METQNENTKFLDPAEILNQLEINPGNLVADFGCGSGYFSIALAQKVGSEGKVFSLDILPQSLESVESRASLGGLDNIVTQRANLEKENGSGLETESLDWVIVKDILFQNKNKKAILKEAFRVLKTGAKLLVVEWKKEFQGVGPEKKLRLDPDQLKKISAEEDFNLEKEIPAGDFHYAMVFRR